MKRIVIEKYRYGNEEVLIHGPIKRNGTHLGIAEIPYFETEGKETDKSRIAESTQPSLKKESLMDTVIIMEGTKRISLPYLYVKEEPDYPRIMGFDFGQGLRKAHIDTKCISSAWG